MSARKVILFNLISLDGLFEGPGADLSWHNVDEAFNEFAIEQLDQAGGLIFGRVTYQMMASFWPSPYALESDPQVASRMNNIPKIVFSRTLSSADWNNTRLVRSDPLAEIADLKQQPGRDLFIFGSANLAAALLQNNLVDEIRLMVNPLVLGRGTPLFQGLQAPVRLRFIKTRTFENGNVLLYYSSDPASG